MIAVSHLGSFTSSVTRRLSALALLTTLALPAHLLAQKPAKNAPQPSAQQQPDAPQANEPDHSAQQAQPPVPAVKPPRAGEPTPPPPPQPSMMPSVPGNELDRVVAIVNGDLILDSDVDEERRFAAFDPYRDAAAGFTRERAIERLINRELIRQQIKLQPDDEIPDADVTKQIDQLRRTIPACQSFHCQTKEGWDRFLTSQGFTETTFFARWKLRMEMLQFISERFQTGIPITPEQIRSYYEKTMLPEYARQHATPPRLDTISNQIEEVLLQRQVSNLLIDWLKSLRAQGSIVVLHPGEEAP